MYKISTSTIMSWLPRLIFFLLAALVFIKYIAYLNSVVPFQYDWEPTDGDHLNFSHRLAQGLPIYLSIKNGEVLSIYNPLYHAIVALLGGEQASLNFARSISLLFWVLTPLSAFLFLKRRWGYIYAAMAACMIGLPPESGMLLDIVQVNPNSTMGFLFLITLMYANYCTDKQSNNWYEWGALGGLAALCFLAKQQGLIAISICVVFLYFQKTNRKYIATTITGFIFIYSLAYLYLEHVNSGEYLNATIFDLKKIMITSFSLSIMRLKEFLFRSNILFTLCVFFSLAYFIFQKYKLENLTIWQVSFLIHLPFLLAILGNGGGGQNYFLTMWLSMVLVCIGTIRNLDVVNHSKIISGLLLISIILNSGLGMKRILHELNNVSLPNSNTEWLMKDYYQSVSALVAGHKNLRILTHRNAGAFVAANLDIRNEGCTMFGYAWEFPAAFNRDAVLSRIKERKFDLISSGFQEFPKEVQLEIDRNYYPVITKKVNLYLGKLGTAIVYAPKPL